ncbi:hypothetical protein Bca4012_088616 [Brassica carinata]
MLKGEHVKISQSYAINLPRQLIPFVNTQSYRLFLKYLSVTFPLHSRASKILSSPIDLPTIKINNCTIQHNTLFNFFPFPNLAIYTVRFKTKVPHIFHDLNPSTVSYADQPLG